MSIMPQDPDSKTTDDPDLDWYITVQVPQRVGSEEYERLMDAIADAAWEAQPDERDWDVFVHGCGPRPDGA